MLLTREEQIDTLHAAATSAGVDIAKEEIHWEDGFLEVDGLKLHYLDWGGAGKTPLLLLHGGLQTAHSWDLTAVVLKRDFHIVALDLRGHGDSDWAPQYSFADHANDLAALVEHLGWDRLVLIGLSLGGLASMSYAAEHHGKLKALVFVDVGPELSAGGVGRIVEFGRGPSEADSVEEFIERAIAHNPRRRAEQLRYSLTHNLRQLPNGKWTWKYDRRITSGRARSAGDGPHNRFDEMWELLGRIQCPTLVVRGADSDVFPEATARRMLDVIPNARLATIPDAGHTVPQDNAVGFLEAIGSFLGDIRP